MQHRFAIRAVTAIAFWLAMTHNNVSAQDEQPAAEESPVIEDGRSVSIEYTLRLEDGTVADTNVDGEPLVYTHGNGQLLPALEKELEGMALADTRSIEISVADGYGEVDPGLFREVPQEQVPEEARQVGQVLYAESPNGQPFQIKVHEIKDEVIVLDLNHPLAGEALIFDIRIVSID
ncbi:MAG: FKBP-type peptidyl-prolyl cis-trans isomerase [Gammaproteobacteria bacterium]|nr:MAG: FKBP-type peptidyl-prolyl cis-trans isomerase [Gammaproteobacteria bacterium]